MATLSRAQFEKAQAFLQARGRRLDIARFAYQFEGSSKEAVLGELAAYQNSDGGFKGEMEGDFLLPAASPMATTIGFQLFRELHLQADHPIVQRGISYLLTSFDEDRGYWLPVPPEVNEHPHAPWWHYTEGKDDEAPDFAPNPSAEIVGYLHQYGGDLCSVDWLRELTSRALKRLQAEPDAMDMHAFLCYLRMAEALSEHERSVAMAKLRASLPHVVNTDPQSWGGYGAKPLYFVSSPDSPLADLITGPVAENLDYEIRAQEEEGCWSPTWSWGQYEEAWQAARIRIQSALTVGTLLRLHHFGRIESM